MYKKIEELYSQNPCFFTRRIRSFKTYNNKCFSKTMFYLELGLLETCYISNPHYVELF